MAPFTKIPSTVHGTPERIALTGSAALLATAGRTFLDVTESDVSGGTCFSIPSAQAEEIALNIGIIEALHGPQALSAVLSDAQMSILWDAAFEMDAESQSALDLGREWAKGELFKELRVRRDRLALGPNRHQIVINVAARCCAADGGLLNIRRRRSSASVAVRASGTRFWEACGRSMKSLMSRTG